MVLGRHPAPPGARFLPHAGQSSNLGPNTELLACCSSPRTYPAPYWSQTFREHWNQIFSIKNQELSDSHLAHQPVELQHALEDGPHQICAPLFKLSVCTTHFLTLEASLALIFRKIKSASVRMNIPASSCRPPLSGQP